MSSKGNAKVRGTDGSDFAFRQRVDKKYEVLASAKSFISKASILLFVLHAFTFAMYYVNPKFYGSHDYLMQNALWIVLLGLNSFTMQNAYITLAQVPISLLSVTNLVGNIGSSYLNILLVVVHLFECLLAYRIYQTRQEILTAQSVNLQKVR